MYYSRLVSYLVCVTAVAFAQLRNEPKLVEGAEDITTFDRNHRELRFLSNVFCVLRWDCPWIDNNNGNNNPEDSNTPENPDTTDSNSTDGGSDEESGNTITIGGPIFGRPIFGPGGFFDNIFGGNRNNSDNGDGGLGNGDWGNRGGVFGFGILPEGGLLDQIINRDRDTPLLEAISNAFQNRTRPFSTSLFGDWIEDANFTDTSCNNTDSAPACLSPLGRPGFWVCRTLYSPFTGVPKSNTQCIGQGQFISTSDECGCCIPEGETEPVCPVSCSCPCDFKGFGDGVRIQYTFATGSDPVQQCISPERAISLTTLSDAFSCVTNCSSA